MAENVTNEPICELPKAVQRDLGSLRDEVRDYRGDDLALKGHVTALMQPGLIQDGILAEMRLRLERVEARLDLRESGA